MRRLWIAPLLLCACRSDDLPEARVQMDPHPDYAKFRPVAIVLLPVEAPRSDLKVPLREACYERLLQRRYSPISLQVIDRRLKETGKFDPADIDWDAKLEIKVTGWTLVQGGTHVSANATARMIHKSGETLCEVRIERMPIALETTPAGGEPHPAAARDFGRTIADTLPARPPIPRE